MRALLLGTALALAGCTAGSGQAPTGNNATAGGKSDSKLICKEETPTGTTFSRTVCRTPDQVEDNRKGADDMLRNQNSRPAFDSK